MEHIGYYNAQKMKFSIKDFFSKCDAIRRKPNVTKPAGVFLIRLI